MEWFPGDEGEGGVEGGVGSFCLMDTEFEF